MSIQLTINTNMQLMSMANQYICVGGLDIMSFELRLCTSTSQSTVVVSEWFPFH